MSWEIVLARRLQEHSNESVARMAVWTQHGAVLPRRRRDLAHTISNESLVMQIISKLTKSSIAHGVRPPRNTLCRVIDAADVLAGMVDKLLDLANVL